jgi:putative lipoprotein
LEEYLNRTYRLFVGAALLTSLCFAQIPEDKILHFAAGTISGYTGYNTFDNIGGAVATSFVVGLGKETYDEIRYGGFDSKDLLATTLGGVAISVTIKLLNKPKDEKINSSIIRSYRKHKRKQSRKERRLAKKDL